MARGLTHPHAPSGAYTGNVCRKAFTKPSDAVIRHDAPLFGDKDWTIKLWFMPESSPTSRHQAIIQKGSPFGNNQFDWRIYWMDTTKKPAQTVGFDYRSSGGNGGFASTTSQLIKVKEWNHLLVSKKDTKIYFYLNGKRIQFMTVGKTNANKYSTLSVGRGNVGGAGQTYMTDAYICDLVISVGVAEQTDATYSLPPPCQCKGLCVHVRVHILCVCVSLQRRCVYVQMCFGA